MKSCARFGLATLMLALLVPHARAQSGHDLFQQALVSERNDGDLQQAMALYRRIADEYAADRQLAARALLRLGSLYELVGSAEATKAYQRVVREYADQSDHVAVARARLAALGPRVVAEETESPIRRLILDRAGNYNKTVVTRDGRHLLRYNVERRGYELIEIESERARQLTSEGPDPTQRLFVDHDLSPDGRQIAAIHLVSADVDRKPDVENDGGRELRTFEVGGRGEGRLIFTWDPGHHVQAFGWSPDQTHIWVFVIRPDRAAEIASVEIADGSIEVLKTLAWRTQSQAPSLSPDGRFIAYHDAESRKAQPDIFLLATDGSQEVRVEDPAWDRKPIFAPDGSGVVFRSNRDGGDLWFLPVVDGRPAGEPRAVWDDLATPYGTAHVFAENGSLFYFFATNGWEVYAADIDLAAGTVGAPEHIVPRHGEVNNAPAFSPDGRFLAHLRHSGRRLVLREVATGFEREFPISGSWRIPAIDFCPDGHSVVVSGHQNEWAVFRVDLDRGGAERLPIAGAFRAVCVGDGEEIVYLTAPDSQGVNRVVHRALATGAETILYEGPTAPYSLFASPNGRRIAFIELGGSEARLLVMPSTGGEAVSVATSPVQQGSFTELRGVMWTPDGEAVLVARANGDEPPDETSPEFTFWRVPLDGGPARKVGSMRLPAFERAYIGAFNYSLHPDGTRLAFERHAGLVAQVWALDNLLQFIQSGKSVTIASPGR